MKRLLLILLCLPMLTLAQQTYVPDDNFEAYLESNGMGNGIANDDYVFTYLIDTVTYLDVNNQFISDLTGIEDFSNLIILKCDSNQLTSLNVSNNTDLTYLWCQHNQISNLNVTQNTALLYLFCSNNQLTSLDVSQNIALTTLYCRFNQLISLNVNSNILLEDFRCVSNQLTTLDVSNNIALIYLLCSDNQLTTLDVSNNTMLYGLLCYGNQLTTLDVSNNTALTNLHCSDNQLTTLDVSNNTNIRELICNSNQLTSLDLRNGNNINFLYFAFTNNSNLFCIDVDDVSWADTNWTVANGNIDSTMSFSTNCSGTTEIEEHTTNTELLKVTDLLGRETKGAKNEVLFYIYDDGTVEKRIVIE